MNINAPLIYDHLTAGKHTRRDYRRSEEESLHYYILRNQMVRKLQFFISIISIAPHLLARSQILFRYEWNRGIWLSNKWMMIA